MSFVEKCSSTVESLQAMLVEYSFGKYELAVVDKLFDALFVSAKLMVLQSVSPRSPKDLLSQLQARASLLPLLILAIKEDCDGIVELCSEACKSSNETNAMFIALDDYFSSKHGTVELLGDEDAAKAQSILNRINS
mgnify:FL=1